MGHPVPVGGRADPAGLRAVQRQPEPAALECGQPDRHLRAGLHRGHRLRPPGRATDAAAAVGQRPDPGRGGLFEDLRRLADREMSGRGGVK